MIPDVGDEAPDFSVADSSGAEAPWARSWRPAHVC